MKTSLFLNPHINTAHFFGFVFYTAQKRSGLLFDYSTTIFQMRVYSPTIRLFSTTTSCTLAKANGRCPLEQRTMLSFTTTFLCCLPVASREPVYTATAHGTFPRVPHSRKTFPQTFTCSEDVPLAPVFFGSNDHRRKIGMFKDCFSRPKPARVLMSTDRA